SVRPACAIRARLRWSRAPRRPFRACCAIPTRTVMADEPVTAPVDAPPDVTDLQRERDQLQRERDDFYDKWLRKSAEFDNYRKRIDRERREQADQAVVNLLQDLLLVVDDFDRARTVDPGDGGTAY